MRDLLLEEVCNADNWEIAIADGIKKGICNADIRQMITPEYILGIYEMFKADKYCFSPSHEGTVPKDDGILRHVWILENQERVLATIINNSLFKLLGKQMVHPSCKSYQSGTGCGKVVQECVKHLCEVQGNIVGTKGDFHHYFDCVNRESVTALFDKMEANLGFSKGTEPVINFLRRTYNDDTVIDLDGNVIQKWNGIRQGNAVASFLADAMLYDLDEYMSKTYSFYVRYSDDTLVITDNPYKAIDDMNSIIAKYGITMNPKKQEILTKDRYFKFLGFSIKGSDISLSDGRVRNFKKEIDDRTIRNFVFLFRDKKGKIVKKFPKSKYEAAQRFARSHRELKKKTVVASAEKCLHSVVDYLYKGDGQYSWATNVLPIVTNKEDLSTLNKYVMDALRATETKHTLIGDLVVDMNGNDHIINRTTGKNVRTNRERAGGDIEGYLTLDCMRNALLCGKGVYDTLVRQM